MLSVVGALGAPAPRMSVGTLEAFGSDCGAADEGGAALDASPWLEQASAWSAIAAPKRG
jgi:hypothetical protein